MFSAVKYKHFSGSVMLSGVSPRAFAAAHTSSAVIKTLLSCDVENFVENVLNLGNFVHDVHGVHGFFAILHTRGYIAQINFQYIPIYFENAEKSVNSVNKVNSLRLKVIVVRVYLSRIRKVAVQL